MPVILGIGIDLMENARMAKELSRGRWQTEGSVFTAAEIRRGNSAARPEECFAGCFAAKEAATKALGARVGDLAMFREVEIHQGGPQVSQVTWHERLKREFEQKGARQILVSVASDKSQTGAIAILES
jgi:holo-[acyl-carrier protein] synthase